MNRPRRLVDLRAHEAAFLLQCQPELAGEGTMSEAGVRASLRRAERLSEGGVSERELLRLARPALPVVYDGAGRRRVPVRAVHQLIAGDRLAEAFLEAVVSRRLRCPRAASPAEPVPPFEEYTEWL